MEFIDKKVNAQILRHKFFQLVNIFELGGENAFSLSMNKER